MSNKNNNRQNASSQTDKHAPPNSGAGLTKKPNSSSASVANSEAANIEIAEPSRPFSDDGQRHLTFDLQIKFLTDWHIGSGLEEPGGDDRLVIRDHFGLPFVPAKTLTAVLRDAAEQLAIGTALESVPLSTENNDPAAADRDCQDKLRSDIVQSPLYQWVLWLFGDQPTRSELRNQASIQGGRLSIRPAHLPETLCEILRPLPNITTNAAANLARRDQRAALTFSKSATRVGRNGQASDRSLRKTEMARKGLILYAKQGSLDLENLSPDERSFAIHFLSAAVYCVERLGGKRRRGAGKVKPSSSGLPDRDAVVVFFEKLNGKIPAPPISVQTECTQTTETMRSGDESPESQIGSVPATPADDTWIEIPFTIQLRTPLLVADRVTGNVVRSLDYLPGTMILPILTRLLKGRGEYSVSELLKADRLRISNASLAFRKGSKVRKVRGLPVPAAFHHAKGEEQVFSKGRVSNRLHEPGKYDEHPKSLRSGFIALTGNTLPVYGVPKRVFRPHNTVDEESQRPTEAVGGVFGYEALAAGTELAGTVRIRASLKKDPTDTKEQSQNEIPAWMNECIPENQSTTCRLGRSSKDDYGQAEITFEAKTIEDQGSLSDSGAETVGGFTVWLTSDLILRTAALSQRPAQALLIETLAESLGVSAADLECDQDPEKPDSFIRYRRHESWHVGWSLPRPSFVSIAAGSCLRVRLKAPSSLNRKQLARLQREGLGERRAEGFGEIRINEPLLSRALENLSSPSGWTALDGSPKAIQSEHQENVGAQNSKSTVHSASDLAVMERIDLIVCRMRIKRAVSAVLGEDEDDNSGSLLLKLLTGKGGRRTETKDPPASQMGVIRSALAALDGPQGADSRLVKLIDNLERRRGDRWPGRSLAMIKELVTSPDEIWKRLGLCFEPSEADATDAGGKINVLPRLAQNPGSTFKIRHQLFAEAVRLLLESAFRKIQRQREASRSGKVTAMTEETI